MARNDYEWSIWEDDVAEAINAETVTASGRFDLFKADVKSPTVLIDCKYTEQPSYGLTASFWKTLCMWARNEAREPVVAIRIRGKKPCEIAIMNEMLFDELTGIDTSDYTDHNQSRKSRSINAKTIADAPTLIELGRARLVAIPFEGFAEVLKKHEEQL